MLLSEVFQTARYFPININGINKLFCISDMLYTHRVKYVRHIPTNNYGIISSDLVCG